MHPHEDPNYNQVTILGDILPAANQMRHRRSIYLESAPGFYSGNNNHGGNPTRVAPAPIQFFNDTKTAFDSKHRNGNIYEMLKPIYQIMRILGIFPISNVSPGHFKPTLQWLAYSVAIFLTTIALLVYVKYFSVDESKFGTEGRFEEAVINYLFTVYAIPIIVPPIVWYESRKLAQVVSDWCHFERVYSKVTKKRMSLFLGNQPIILTVALPVLASGTMVVTHVTMEHRLFEVVPYSYINTVIYLIGGYWFMQCDLLGKIALLVADDFQAALKLVGPSTQVSDYRTLWMLLGKLIRDVGNASGYTVTFLALYLFMIVTLTIYGLLSQLQLGLNSKDIGLTITAVFALCFLFFICDEAHYASNCVRVQFQKKLLLVELTWMNEDVQQEINMFIRATEMSPTDINAVGFFDVNRNLFKSLLATMVTYLVVLLQFQISIPSDGGPNNATSSNKTQMLLTTTQSPK